MLYLPIHYACNVWRDSRCILKFLRYPETVGIEAGGLTGYKVRRGRSVGVELNIGLKIDSYIKR